MPQITLPGGLWSESQNIYRAIGGKPNKTRYEWEWPRYNTAIKFASMQYEDDRLQWQGSQLAYIGFEELTHYTEEQFFYMFSRARTMCGITPRIRCTTNPDADSWVKTFLVPWIDEHYPNPARSGEIRWFVRDGGVIHWLAPNEQHPDAVSVTFIAASIFDNSALLNADPSYLSSLKALPFVERQRLLYGDWSARASGILFRRDWFPRLIAVPPPQDIERLVRYWDLAATAETGTNDPDWTAGVLVAKIKQGGYNILDYQRMRGTPAEVERMIRSTADADGRSVAIFMEQEPGSSGVNTIDHYRRRVLDGYVFQGVKTSGKKEARANPVSSQAQGRAIGILQAHWTDTLLSELEAFPTKGVHDDGCVLPDTLLPYIAHDDIISCIDHHHEEKKAMLTGEAQTLKEGDFIQTHTGKWQQILRVMTRPYSGDIVTIKPSGGFDLSLTPEHPVLCIRRKSQWEKRVSGSPEWIEASEVRTGDVVLESIDQTITPMESIDLAEWLRSEREDVQGKRSNAGLYLSKILVEDETIRFNNPRSHPIKRFVPVNADFCRLLGYYVAEGSLGKHNISWSFHRDEVDYHKDVQRLVDSLFGTLPSIRYREGKQVAEVYVSSLVLHDFFAQFGRGARNKVIPQWMLHLPVELQIEFLKGAWRGDGCVASTGGYDKLVYSSASRPLTIALRMMLYRLGIVPVLSISRPHGKSDVIRESSVSSGPLYNLCVGGDYAVKLAPMIDEVLARPSVDNAHNRIVNGYVQRGVRKVELSHYEGSVYNFEVAQDHSYQTESFIVHNCDALFGAMEQLFGKSAQHHIDWSRRYIDARRAIAQNEAATNNPQESSN